jgi:hypothetical protein
MDGRNIQKELPATHPMRLSKLRQFAVATMALVLIFPLVLLTIGQRERRRAEAFLNDMTKLKIGETTFAGAEQLASRYGGTPWAALPQTTKCSTEECYFYFEFANPRNRLPFVLVSRVVFNGIVHVKESRVLGIEIGYQTDSRFGGRAAYDVRDTPLADPPLVHSHYNWVSPGYGMEQLKVDSSGRPWIVEVRLNERSTQQERSQAYSINLSCLAKIYGCNAPTAILPKAGSSH